MTYALKSIARTFVKLGLKEILRNAILPRLIYVLCLLQNSEILHIFIINTYAPGIFLNILHELLERWIHLLF